MHGQQGIHMVGVLLQQSHDGVGIKAGLALLKQHLDCLHTTYSDSDCAAGQLQPHIGCQ